MLTTSTRFIYSLGLITVALLLLLSLYLQFYQHIEPCPLCTLQRMTFALIGITFFLGLFFSKRLLGRIFINILISCFAIVGICLSGRQIYMQHYPMDASGECAASLNYLLHTFPLNQVLQKILLQGSMECTKNGFVFLYLNMAEWALIWFSVLLLVGLWLILSECTRS